MYYFKIFCTRGTFTSSTSGGLSFVKIERILDVIRPILRSASMESSPTMTVSVKLEIIVQKWRKCLFLFALLTWLGCRWSGLQREPQQHNLPSFFCQNEDGNLCLYCCRCSACLFCCCLGRRQSIVCVARPASVVCMTRGTSVTWLNFLLFLREFFIACFLVVLDILVAGDLKHEYAQSAWDFLFRGPPGCCVLRACVAAIDAPLMMIVVMGWVSSWYAQRPHNTFVMFVGKAALWLCHGSPHHIRRTLISWALWRFTMMALIASITISDGFDHAHCNWQWGCCLLLLVATVPSSNACVVFTARIFNSLITIQTELSLD